MPMKGDFDKLQALQRGLQLAGQRGAQECARYAAAEALKLARGQVRRAESPDGKPWAPLVLSNQAAQNIQRRAERAEAKGRALGGGLRKPLAGVADDAKATVQGGTAELELPHEGAFWANRGTRKMIRRQITPLAGEPMPERWRRRILARCTFIVWRLIKRGNAPAEFPGIGDGAVV